jgi:hypothetical protein
MSSPNDPECIPAADHDREAAAVPDPFVEPEAGREDDGLILWMLALTPTQRLEVAQGFVDSVQALRNGRRV